MVFEIFLRVTLHDDFGLPVDETKSVVQVCTAELAARRIRSSESFETFQDIFSGGAMVFSKFQIFMQFYKRYITPRVFPGNSHKIPDVIFQSTNE